MSLNNTLDGLISSLKQTNDSITAIHDKIDSPELPELVLDLLKKTNTEIPEGVSLLDLKNNSMLSYINNLILIIFSRIESTKVNNDEKIQNLKNQAVKNSIIQRITLEKGVKTLEKKLNYQLEKMIRNYNKMDKDSNEDTINKKLESQEDGENNESDEDSEEEDELNYKPDTSSLMKSMKSNSIKSKDQTKSSSDSKEKVEKYKAPKISAVLPPSEFKDQNSRKSNKSAKLSSMEEYLQETGDAPLTTSSIGSDILNNGRGGVQTERQKRKEEEIKRFEESNFTRISSTVAKKQDKRKRNTDAFFGEDWGIFNNKTDSNMNTKRTKPKSAWDRAKKRRTDQS
ncbi:hypothetical protein WICMUC_004778 [Wickerhamomyces mucosus]|uniref:Uncharacterized protein n=1 Tax=Wickerhamomyces mucosus TaxID=1378264 RepID=A0A9P8T9R1_9ASCO|nr:hypothetical protein WICMUC_004778 [Wickerhamomyces mucosus]